MGYGYHLSGDGCQFEYLAVVLDLFGRKVVGWSIGTSLATDLVSDALHQAIENRRPDGKQLLHHSDRGCEYISDAYQATLKALGIECSMSRTGNCYDNAVMERFGSSPNLVGNDETLLYQGHAGFPMRMREAPPPSPSHQPFAPPLRAGARAERDEGRPLCRA